MLIVAISFLPQMINDFILYVAPFLSSKTSLGLCCDICINDSFTRECSYGYNPKSIITVENYTSDLSYVIM